MTIELLHSLSLAAYIAAGIFLLTSIVLFFLLNIKKVIGDVSGTTARKAIQTIREQNEATGNKAYKPSSVNVARGKITDKISPSGKLTPQIESYGGSPGTEKLNTNDLSTAARESVSISGTSETTVLSFQSGETTVLNEENSNQTTLLPQDSTVNPKQNRGSKGNNGLFKVEVEMGFSDSSEIIE